MAATGRATARSGRAGSARRAGNGGPQPKLAARVSDRIVDDVIAGGWPVGEVLGSEGELLARYGVSRAVFREAVRLVEHKQVARMRRGPGGGLIVTEPTVEAIIDAVVIYLHRVGVRLDEVFEARFVLEEIVVDQAPSRLDEADIERLRQLIRREAAGEVEDHRELHSLLASLTRNPALELFVDMLNQVSLLYFADRQALETQTVIESARAHARIAEAVLAGNEDLARRRMRKHLEAEADYLRGRRSSHQVLDPATAITGPPGAKLAEGVARSIFHQILVGRIEPGTLIGSEAELMDRHGVSRAIFREAVRLLEHHHIARMRRGPGGGLFVLPPSVSAVTDVLALYLARHGIELGHLVELRIGVELALVDLAIAGGDQGLDRLHDALEAELTASDEELADVGHDLHATLASVAGNRALELVALVLIRLARLREMDLPDRSRREIRHEVHRTHVGITEAIVAGDREVARHRVRRHLEAVGTFLR